MGSPEAGALTGTFERERRGLLAHAYRMLGAYHEAEDVVQDTYVRVLRGWKTFERRSSVRTWLYRIATNVCLNVIESRGRRPLTLASLNQLGHLYGLVRLSNGVQTVCGAVAIREDGGPDWLDFYVPIGALEHADPRVNTHFPGGPSDTASCSLTWRHPIDAWLAQVGASVHNATGYRLGLIGWEVSGQAYAADVAANPPQRRGMGYLIPGEDHLRFLPATE
jgi:hypothetical protein